MSQVLAAFRSALATAVRAPMHVTVVLVVGTAAALASVLVPLVPIVGLLAGPFVDIVLLAPLVLAALVGSAHAVRNDDGAWAGAQSAVENHWIDLVGAYGAVTVLWIVVGGTLGAVLFLGAVGLGSLADPQSLRAGTTAILVALPSLLVILLTVGVGMVLQFAAPAAVVADADAVESLKTAVRFSMANPLGIVGFSLVAVGVAVVASLPGAALAATVWYFGNEIAAAVILLIGFLEAATVAGAITSIYLVEYFERAADPSVLPEGSVQSAKTDDTGGFQFGQAKNVERR